MINNDLRRVLLWSVFAVSLLMLWDGWLRHTGQPSLFQPAPAVTPVAQGASGADGAQASVPSAGATLGGSPTATSPVEPGASAAPASEVLSFSTDVLKVDIDTLVKQVAAAARPGDHIVCMSNGGFGGIHERLLKALAS